MAWRETLSWQAEGLVRCKQGIEFDIEGAAPAGVKRYAFSSNAAYAKEPPCGEMPDGIQYFEVPTGAERKVLFVRIGQDEQTLEVLPSR
jgi:hypothetical protein